MDMNRFRELIASTMNETERFPESNGSGKLLALNDLVPLVYTELRRLAAAKMSREKPGQTLQATALVHEVWLRLGRGAFANQAHFFAAASEAMRRILIERARRKQREKRGGGVMHLDIDEVEIAMPQGNEEEALAVNEALDQLEAVQPRKAELVKLRYFVGLSLEEVADVMGTSLTAAKRDWAYARAWLHRKIAAGR
jgi:RNA polymerase sigma factor (TIGR02999 family)